MPASCLTLTQDGAACAADGAMARSASVTSAAVAAIQVRTRPRVPQCGRRDGHPSPPSFGQGGGLPFRRSPLYESDRGVLPFDIKVLLSDIELRLRLRSGTTD